MSELNIGARTATAPYHTSRRGRRFAPAASMRNDDLSSTAELVSRVKSGDAQALEDLCARYLQPLRRWASGRLPRWSRDMNDTDDLVQDTVIHALRRLDGFEARHPGALQGYLRQAIVNRIRDDIRRHRRRPYRADLDENAPAADASPLEQAIGHEAVERYEAALATLGADDRDAIISRIELDHGYEQVADDLGKPSAAAARMAVGRALVRLAAEMNRRAD